MTNVLFLCTGNSARSIMAESYLNHIGGDWAGYSAGSNPTGTPHPMALQTLAAHGVTPQDGDGASPRSKSWNDFSRPPAPVMDVVITVCDNAAAEVCPIWPTRPETPPPRKLHWSFPDPAAAEGSEEDRLATFSQVFANIRSKIDELTG
ncbi:arsenate reductase ArsC [Parvularcula sp. LCG005]|uniref:arsenate reductase ArsC n=1 Tax=Parvularcula sp. LCG005 TaxID=3078805 RepID=UPI0029438B79|nr:arsenate reductase ArsC [Parvularcula sp. LCG005]WOI53206.1 arsenate reductase ArsC [Parvularcula sp. LCG005]